MHKCTILHPLMWVFFGSKCVKRLHFSILQKFTQSDVIALTLANGGSYAFPFQISILLVTLGLSRQSPISVSPILLTKEHSKSINLHLIFVNIDRI